jgi:hypothetical protein
MNLDAMIRDAMSAGMIHSLIPRETADRMRARLDELTGSKTAGHKPDGCPVCIVRALTEGEPRPWFPSEPASVKGVVIKVGLMKNPYSMVMGDTLAFVDLWLAGTDRVRIISIGARMRNAIERAAPTVGDTLTVAYTGQGTIDSGKYRGRAYRMHTVEIQRGHH